MSKYEDHFFELYNVVASMNDEGKKLQAIDLFVSDGYEIKENDITDYFCYEGTDYLFRVMLHKYKGTLSKDTIMDVITLGSGVPIPELLIHAEPGFKLSTDEIMDLLYSFNSEDILSFKYLFDIITPSHISGDTFRDILDTIPEKAYKYAKKYLRLLPPDEGLEIWQDYYQDLDESKFYKDYYNRPAELSYDEIMKEIKEGFSGNAQTDLDYIKLQMEQYKNHKYSKEIIRELGRMEYALLPDEAKKEINQVAQKNNEEFEDNLDLVRYLIFQKRYDDAIELLEEIVADVEKSQSYEDDAVNEYYCFKEAMEGILHELNYKSRKSIRSCPIDYATLYYLYGNVLFEKGNYNEAKIALEKARRWNPASVEIGFEYAETLKALGEYEDYYDVTMRLHPFIFKLRDIARFYRNLGYYFIEKKDYKVATSCYVFSGEFDRSEVVPAELYYIYKTSGVDFEPTADELNEIFDKNEIPIYISREVLNAAYALGKDAKEEGDMRCVLYFWGIFDDLVEDDEVKETLERIKNENAI